MQTDIWMVYSNSMHFSKIRTGQNVAFVEAELKLGRRLTE
jgi:hypothetical protein